MKKKNKNKLKVILIILLILFVLAIMGVFCYFKFFKENDNNNEVKVVKKIDNYDYNLKENETELYNVTFDELEELLKSESINYESYAKIVAKLFIIDFYTLTNKLSKNDIGGIEFIKDSMKDNFIEEARSTFYKYLEVKSDKRIQKLPEVSNIKETTVESTQFKYLDKTIDENAYKVTISWEYKEDLGYETEAKMIIVKENDKLYIVEMD